MVPTKRRSVTSDTVSLICFRFLLQASFVLPRENLIPMENAVTIRAQSNAFVFGLFHRLLVGSIRRKFVNLLHVLPQYVVKVDDRWVGRAAMDTFFCAFVGDPHLPVSLFVPSGGLHMLFFVALIPRVRILALIFGVLIRQIRIPSRRTPSPH
jgi:hypothetical protein